MSRMESYRKSLRDAPWSLWASQLSAVMRIELKKSLWMRRSIWIYFLALAPVVIIGLDALLNHHAILEENTRVFAYTFQFYLHGAIFFACMGLFTWLFRGEVVEKSLHYYFLAPMRRQVLIVGKFLAGLIASVVIFGGSVLLASIFMYAPLGPAGRAFVFDGPGLGQLLAYLGVTALACVGYGSVFLALSLVFKNPILPGIVVLLWETFHAVLPALLQKLSVMFYLKQLSPVPIPPEGAMALFTVIAEPVPAWIAVPGLLALCGAILLFACFKIKQVEISYLAD
jgi:ABC-type transport system involved in multi-copper enzyme maturation permease subunit